MKSSRIVFLVIFILVSFFLVPRAFSQSPLERKIIVFKTVVPHEERINLLARYQAIFGKELKLINGMAISLPKGMAEKLSKESGVLRVDPDVEVYALPKEPVSIQGICDWFPNWKGCTPTPTLTPIPTPTLTLTPTPATPTQAPIATLTPTPTPEVQIEGGSQTYPWGISRISAPGAWSISQGQQVKVAIIDTGIDTDHPDLKNNLAGCRNFISAWKTCEDDNGHGTHVSGIIAAENNSIGVVGVAPKARIYALKVLDRRGSGYLSDVIEGLDWAVQNRMQVVNMSLGAGTDVASLHEAIIKAHQAGIIQVAAAGNSGPGKNTVLYPAKYPEVIAVSAIESSGTVPFWSSQGAEIDLAAPGVNINSTYLKGTYKIFSGTSMASPHVAGVAALRLYLKPSETPSQIESVLEQNADTLPFDSTLVGAGLVNAQKVTTAP